MFFKSVRSGSGPSYEWENVRSDWLPISAFTARRERQRRPGDDRSIARTPRRSQARNPTRSGPGGSPLHDTRPLFEGRLDREIPAK